MLVASPLRRLNRTPYESKRAQKLNKEKEKLPTHTPVGYQAIVLQVTYFQHHRPRNYAKLRSTQEAELHRYRCNVSDFPGYFPGLNVRDVPVE
jgi:hypothetical protein